MTSSADSPYWYHRLAEGERNEAIELYSILADERRRVVLDVVDQSDGPVTEPELARLVAAHESGNTPDEVTSTARERVQISLHHVHLPHLEAHGLIERTDDDAVTRKQHPIWTDSDLRTFLTQTDADPTTTTTTLKFLTNSQRRAILAFLYEHKNATVGELAEELAGTPFSGQELSSVLVELRHRHLPKLEAANVIETDSTENRVHYTGNVFLENWFAEAQARG